jgi:diguanylate cyclase (GGDEF)-like protein
LSILVDRNHVIKVGELVEHSSPEFILEQLKVKIYLFILPFVVIATGLGWIMDFFYSDNPITIDSFLFPLLDIWLLFCLIYIAITKRFPRTLEMIALSIAILIYFIWFANTMSYNIQEGSLSGGLGEFTNWVPFFFIVVFLIFDQKMALFVSMIIFSTTVVIGLGMSIFYKQEFTLQTYDSLMQFYISNAVYILALYFLQRFKLAFIQKEAMQHLANTDYLTNLPNRRLVEKRLSENSSREMEFSVIIFDVDHFKKINDFYGHDIGDQVLKEFASLIQENIRDKDIVGRWGGEEFVIIANDLNAKQAVVFSDRLRKLIEDTTFSHKEKVTASFGVAEYRPKEKIKDVLKRADIALYMAKENGRNKVEILI